MSINDFPVAVPISWYCIEFAVLPVVVAGCQHPPQPGRVVGAQQVQERRPAGARTTASSPGVTLSTSVTELLGLASVGGPLAWDETMRRYHHLVLAKVRSFRLQDADAHDAMQMTWLRLIENHHRILFPELLDRWLATTASRECLSILRDAKHSPNQNNTAMDHVADPAASPEQHVAARSRCHCCPTAHHHGRPSRV
jgi:hypothetical protein